MTPFVKEAEPITSAGSSAATPNLSSRNPQESAARPQPVPLEVAVTVNGARTIDGTDKREPFSESTKTVLVFANGAVIRLNSSVSPGQLLFVTNEKSKREVVCQVVKARSDGKMTGYVELEFTEAAAGFWGMRMSAEAVGAPPPVGAPKNPVVATAVTPSALAPSLVPPPLPPRASAPPLVVPQQPAPQSATIPAVAPPPSAPQPVASAGAPPIVATLLPVVAPPAVPTIAPPKASVAPPPPPAPPVAAKPSAPNVSRVKIEEAATPLPAAEILPAPPAPDISTEELRQHAARLQEQLNALLFREAAAQKATPPASEVAVPKMPAPEIPNASLTAPAAPEELSTGTDAARQVLELAEPVVKPPVAAEREAAAEPIKVQPLAPTSIEAKQPSLISKTAPIALKVEEVKIPSWLAPLAQHHATERESEESASASQAGAPESQTEISDPATTQIEPLAQEETSQRSAAVMFGGELLGGASPAQNVKGSKKGLYFGLAAAVAISIGGGVWYGAQPGNFLSQYFRSAPSTTNTAVTANVSAAPTEAPAPAPETNATRAVSSQPGAAVRTSAASPTTSPAPISNGNPNNNTTAPPVLTPSPSANNSSAKVQPAAHAAASPVEQAQKPILGDVRLTTPNVNRSADAQNGDAAPTIDSAQPAAGDPLSAIPDTSHGNGPAVPLPVGGDIRPAHLLKSAAPIYPPNARAQRVAGDVIVDALVDASGNVASAKIIKGPALLYQAAITAVKQWKYAPAQLDGNPTAMHLTVTVQFRLQ